MNRIILIPFFLAYAVFLWGQEPVMVSLEDLKQKMLANNIDLRISAQEIEKSMTDKEMTTKYLLPSVQLSTAFTSTNTPLNAFGTKLQQSIISQEDFNPALLNDPAHVENLNAGIQVMQPLINLDAPKYKKATTLAVDAAKSGHKRMEEYMAYNLEEAYLQLQFAYAMKGKLEDIQSRAERTVGIVENAREVGYAYPDDVMKAEVRKRQVDDQILETEMNIKSISQMINIIIGGDLEEILQPELSMDTTIIVLEDINLNQNRDDFTALKQGLAAAQAKTAAIKNTNLPRLNAFASYETNLHKAIDGGHGYMAGVQLSWNIFDGGKNSTKVQKAKIDEMKTQLMLEKKQLEGRQQLLQQQNQRAIISTKITTAKAAIDQAKESLRISTNRYEEGVEKTTDLIMKEIELSENEINLIQLLFNYQSNNNAIRFTAG